MRGQHQLEKEEIVNIGDRVLVDLGLDEKFAGTYGGPSDGRSEAFVRLDAGATITVITDRVSPCVDFAEFRDALARAVDIAVDGFTLGIPNPEGRDAGLSVFELCGVDPDLEKARQVLKEYFAKEEN